MRYETGNMREEYFAKLLFIEVIEFMASMAYNGYVAGCSGDGVSRPVPTRRRTYLVTHVCVFFVDQDVKPPISGGQEVQDNPTNCVLIYIYRNPPDPIGIRSF